MKKLLLVISMLFMLTACSYKDLNDMGIVSTIGIEYKNDEYIMSVRVLNPTKDNIDNYDIYTKECKDIERCLNDISILSKKEIYFSHLEVLFLNNNLKLENINKIIDFFINREESRNSFDVVVVENIDDNLMKIDSKEIDRILKNNISNISLMELTMDDFIKDIYNYNLSYVPYLNQAKKIASYKYISKESFILTNEESLIINFLKYNLPNNRFYINDKLQELEECNTTISVDKGNAAINVNCKGNNLINDDYIEKYLNDLIIKQANKSQYIKSILEKLNYKLYHDKDISDIKFTIAVNITDIKESA